MCTMPLNRFCAGHARHIAEHGYVGMHAVYFTGVLEVMQKFQTLLLAGVGGGEGAAGARGGAVDGGCAGGRAAAQAQGHRLAGGSRLSGRTTLPSPLMLQVGLLACQRPSALIYADPRVSGSKEPAGNI